MVDVNPAEWDMARKAGVKFREEMNEIDRIICGADQAKHLIIPMSDVYNLRRIAEVLRSVASDLDFLSRRTDIKARTIILETRAIVDDANRQIREFKTGKSNKVS